MEMSSVAISAPSAPPTTAIQSLTVAFGSFTFVDLRDACSFAPAASVDAYRYGETRQQQRTRLLVRFEMDTHGNALDDLREVARGILSRKQGELRACAGRET